LEPDSSTKPLDQSLGANAVSEQSQPGSPTDVPPPATKHPGVAPPQGESAPDPDAPSKVAPSDKPPEFAKKADDLEMIKKTVDDAASVSGGLWLSYILVLFYLAVAAGAVTHSDLFFEKAVKLPFLGIDLPLVGFFFLAPILFVIVHAYTLVHLIILIEKAKRYHQALHDPERNVTNMDRENLQFQLPSNIFIQFLFGPSGLRGGLFGWLLRTIAWVTLVIAPILLLLMMQLQFLPFHSLFVTWTQRVALVVDLTLIWWLWGRILSGREINGSNRGSWGWTVLGIAFSLAAILFSGAAATFPGEWQGDQLPEWRFLPALTEWGKPATEKDPNGNPRTASFWDWLVNAERLTPHDWLFNEKPDSVSRRRFPFSSTLLLSGENVYEGLGIDDPEKAKWRDYVFHAQKRNLRGAIFDHASLPKVDFSDADLRGARLDIANLQGARLEATHLEGASLVSAKLQGASLAGAFLQGASLLVAQLQGASLDAARLQGAQLNVANLQGASLDSAHLEGASLVSAQLQGALLPNSQLQGASLDSAHLEGASLPLAQLQGVSFSGATLVATDLRGAHLWRSNQAGAPTTLSSLRMSVDDKTWRPDDKAYEDLSKTLQSLSPGPLHDALGRIEILDCSNRDKTLQSCNSVAPLTPEATGWRNAVTTATAGDDGYRDALAKSLKALICSGDENAIFVVRALFVDHAQGRLVWLTQVGPAALDLIAKLLSKDSSDCPVAASLTDADRAALQRIKQGITSVENPGG
jgi:hypothetical protein